MPQKHAARRPTDAPRQRGVYAIEFAFVFLLFFALIYGIICYGILFTFRFGLQNAAEDGARAALRYQASLPLRTAQAAAVAKQQTIRWLPVTPLIDAKVCQIEGGNCTAPVCGIEWSQRCEVVVTVTASGMGGVLPPLMNLAMPDTLAGQASMLLDGRAL
jgi:Flp pilus assembly protein TadG